MKFKHYAIGVIGAAALLLAATGCPTPKEEPVPGETRTFDGIEFQWCPAGTFTMGSSEDEVGHYSDEAQHKVTIGKGFWLGKYEVTQAQWKELTGTRPSYFNGADRPVESVRWDDAQEFIALLNAVSNGSATYRLPTESEWEYAYRAGTRTRFYWGNDPRETAIDANAWYEDNGNSETHPVGEKLPNKWGLYDMSGNVWEWCQDWYGTYPLGPVTDPQGPSTGVERVTRGGSINFPPSYCRAAIRLWNNPDVPSALLGFRLLRTAN